MTAHSLFDAMLEEIAGFEWDDGNREKCQKHGVSIEEIEELFESEDIFVGSDGSHSQNEERFNMVGRSQNGRMIFLVFTFRLRETRRLVRIISARYMHRREVEDYEEDISDI